MTDTDYAVVLFHSTQGAIKAERVLLQAGFAVRLVPTPRQFSSDCGTALRCAWVDADAVCSTLKAEAAEYDSVRRMTVQQ